jgi:hypothetical protein
MPAVQQPQQAQPQQVQPQQAQPQQVQPQQVQPQQVQPQQVQPQPAHNTPSRPPLARPPHTRRRPPPCAQVGSKAGYYTGKSPKLILHEWCLKEKRPRPKYKAVQQEDGSFRCKVGWRVGGCYRVGAMGGL